MWSRRRCVLYILVALLPLVCLVRLWNTDKVVSSSSPRTRYATSIPQLEGRQAASQSVVEHAQNQQRDGSREMAEYDLQQRHKLLSHSYGPAEQQPVTVKDEQPFRPGAAEVAVREEQPAEVAVREEQPAEVAVREEQPAEVAVREEQPAEVAVREEQPAEVAVTEEQPAEVAVTEEQPAEVAVTEEQPAEVAVTEEQPAEDPHSKVVESGLQHQLPSRPATKPPSIITEEKASNSVTKATANHITAKASNVDAGGLRVHNFDVSDLRRDLHSVTQATANHITAKASNVNAGGLHIHRFDLSDHRRDWHSVTKATANHITAKTTPGKSPTNGKEIDPDPEVPAVIHESMIQPCNDSLCFQYLSSVDKGNFQECARKQAIFKFLVTDTPTRCRFMNAGDRSPVALSSYPGSGNTWVRGLLEQATGICTGSVRCDPDLRASGMTGERVESGNVLVVKTHRRDHIPRWTNSSMQGLELDKFGSPKWAAAILIIRNPLHAMVAEWNRQRSNLDEGAGEFAHVEFMEENYFGSNVLWQQFVAEHAKTWAQYVTRWCLSGHHRVLPVRYEDLKTDKVREVKKMLDFLKFPYLEEELERRLKTDFITFYRNHRPTFDPYTLSLKEYVWNIVNKTVQVLRERNHGDSLGVEDYLNGAEIRMAKKTVRVYV